MCDLKKYDTKPCSIKRERLYSWLYLCQSLTDLQISFNDLFCGKFAVKWLLKTSLNCNVAILPCETFMSENKQLTINYKVM